MLKVEFKQIENVVLMKVLEQGDEIELGCGCFFEYGDIKLCSVSYPQIHPYSLYVKGKSECSQDVYGSISFDTPEEASECIMKFTECIDAYNKSDKDQDLLWKPNIDDGYYSVSSNYESPPCLLYYWDYTCDSKLVKNFGAFKTEEQAETVRKHHILMNLLWQLKFALCPDYEFKNNSMENCFIEFEGNERRFYLTNRDYNLLTPVFDRESAEKAVKYLNLHKELWENLL